MRKRIKQAGAELSQAQEKLGLAKPALPSKKLRWSSISKDIPLTTKNEVVCDFLKI